MYGIRPDFPLHARFDIVSAKMTGVRALMKRVCEAFERNKFGPGNSDRISARFTVCRVELAFELAAHR